MISRVFMVGQLQYQCECVCTWYDFRGLDLHKALVGEGVPEELAHSRLQAEDGLAGGGLQDTNMREKGTISTFGLGFVPQHKWLIKSKSRFLS